MDASLRAAANEYAKTIRRAEVRGILKLCRHTGEVITYVPLAKTFGMFSGGTELAEILGALARESHDAGEALLPSLVVSSATGMPGRGYFDCARYLGYKVAQQEAAEHDFWADQMRRLGFDPNAVLASFSRRGPSHVSGEEQPHA